MSAKCQGRAAKPLAEKYCPGDPEPEQWAGFVDTPAQDMITVAAALTQCVTRTHSGWMVRPAGAAGSIIGSWEASTLMMRSSNCYHHNKLSAAVISRHRA